MKKKKKTAIAIAKDSKRNWQTAIVQRARSKQKVWNKLESVVRKKGCRIKQCLGGLVVRYWRTLMFLK